MRYQSAEEGSSRDSLTGLANHRSFQEEVQREVARAQRHGGPLSVAMIDVDDFKVVNDQAGHRHGDEMLVELGAALESGRLFDRAFRVGGDEFALILPQTDSEGASVAAEWLRVTVAARLPGTTVSIGLATWAAKVTPTCCATRLTPPCTRPSALVVTGPCPSTRRRWPPCCPRPRCKPCAPYSRKDS